MISDYNATNIQSRFRVSGIHPYNDNMLFGDEKSAEGTNIPLTQAEPQPQPHVAMIDDS